MTTLAESFVKRPDTTSAKLRGLGLRSLQGLKKLLQLSEAIPACADAPHMLDPTDDESSERWTCA